MGHPQVLVKRPHSDREVFRSLEAPGRPWRRPAGGWIADGVALRKCITLCDTCDPKFHPKRLGYELFRRSFGTTGPYVVSDCWGCNQRWIKCKAYIHESTHDLVGDPARRRGRWTTTLASIGYPTSQ